MYSFKKGKCIPTYGCIMALKNNFMVFVFKLKSLGICEKLNQKLIFTYSCLLYNIARFSISPNLEWKNTFN